MQWATDFWSFYIELRLENATITPSTRSSTIIAVQFTQYHDMKCGLRKIFRIFMVVSNSHWFFGCCCYFMLMLENRFSKLFEFKTNKESPKNMRKNNNNTINRIFFHWIVNTGIFWNEQTKKNTFSGELCYMLLRLSIFVSRVFHYSTKYSSQCVRFHQFILSWKYNEIHSLSVNILSSHDIFN